MSRLGAAFAVALALCATGACRRPPADRDVVASARSGDVRLRDVEPALAAAVRPGETQAADPLGRYRKTAEMLVIQRAVLAEIPDVTRALAALGPEYEGLRRDVIVDLYGREVLRAETHVPEQEIADYYRKHPEEFHRLPQRVVSHIFRRHEDPARPGATLAFLASLKRRQEAGEPFADLARQYSQSETRLLDGRLGLIGRGRLPKRLETVVFALRPGQASDPVLVSGGAVLFYVSEAIEEKRFSLEDARSTILQKLQDRRLRDAIDEQVADQRPPAGSVIEDAETLQRKLELETDDEEVLSVAGYRVTTKEFREALTRLRATTPPAEIRAQMWDLYDLMAKRQLLYLKAVASGFPEAPERRAVIEPLVRRVGLDLLVRKRLEERLWQRVDAAPRALERFYEDNRFLYQTSLRLKLRTLVVAPGPDPARRMAEMEAMRVELQQGRLTLEHAAARLRGRVQDIGWLDGKGQAALEPKVRVYLLQMNTTGYSVPFQLGGVLSLVWVEKREEPRVLPFAEVRDRVRKDYFTRSQQEIYGQVTAEILQQERFEFHEAAVRTALAGPQS